MENVRNGDPLSRPCTSTQTMNPSIESRGMPPSESYSASSANTSSRFYFPASSRRIFPGSGGGAHPCCRMTSFEQGRNDNQSSALPRDRKEQTTGESLLRMRPNAATCARREPPTCSCFLRRRCEKATETLTPSIIETTKDLARARVPQEPLPVAAVTEKTFGGCHSRRETTNYEPESASMIQFYKTNDKAESQDSTALTASRADSMVKKLPSKVFTNDLTPKEIMNTWLPGKEKPIEGLFTPGENYIDVSMRDFSLRKYFPEMFLSETEKKEMRDKVRRESQERDAATQKDLCRNQKCPQGKCNGEKDEPDQDWRTIIELGSEIRTPCPWSAEGTTLTPVLEELNDEESNVTLTPEKRPRGWLRWSCRKLKHDKKTEKKEHDRKQD